MAHEVEQMFSVGQRPWHGLGTVLDNPPSVQEAIKLAGLDWKVSLRDIVSNDSDSIIETTHKIVVREDNKQPLGVVGSGYKVLQNDEAFDFFQPFLENDLATLETAGCLRQGKRIFVLAKIKSENMVINPEDEIEKYVLLSNAHDGTQALRVGFVPIRVVCNNTLSMAIKNDNSKLIRLTHKGDIVSNLAELRETMDLVNKQFIATEEQFRRLATKQVNINDLHKYVKTVFSDKKLNDIITNYEEECEKIEQERKKLIARIEEIFDLEPAHNVWTMYNSVNYYLNHERGKTLEDRYNSMWFGQSKRIDHKALQIALSF